MAARHPVPELPNGLRIRITYADGVEEILECGVLPDVVLATSWQPGVVMAEPSGRCPVRSDYFLTMMNEGGRLGGFYFDEEFTPANDEDDFDPHAFRWIVMSTAIEAEDGFRFWFQTEGACWTDTQDPADRDMTVDSGPDGLPAFDPPVGYKMIKDDRWPSSRSAEGERFEKARKAAQQRMLTDFDAQYRQALADAGLSSNVDVTLVMPFRTGRYIELDMIEATPMRQGHGTKAMRLLVDMADRDGISLMLRVADENEDAYFDEDDPDRMPTFDELTEWYGRFGFDPDFGDRMMRVADAPQVVRRLEAPSAVAAFNP